MCLRGMGWRSADQRQHTWPLTSPTQDTDTTVTIVDAELPTVTSFKYLGSLFTGEAGSQADVNNRIRIGWMKWKEVSGVLFERKMSVELKDNVSKTIIRPALTYGCECWAAKKEIWEQTKFIRNEDVEMGTREDEVGPHQKWRHQEGGAHKTCCNVTRKQKTKVVWPLLEGRREPNHICAKSLGLEVSGRKSRGRPKKEMEGQHNRRHEEITTDWRYGTRSNNIILDD